VTIIGKKVVTFSVFLYMEFCGYLVLISAEGLLMMAEGSMLEIGVVEKCSLLHNHVARLSSVQSLGRGFPTVLRKGLGMEKLKSWFVDI